MNSSATSEGLKLCWKDKQCGKPEVEITSPDHGHHCTQLAIARDHQHTNNIMKQKSENVE